MSEEQDLSLSSLLNEGLIRDIVLFTFLFVLTINLEWNNLLLLVFPLISFGFSLVFKIINANKSKTQFEPVRLLYNPLGSEKKNGNRLFFCALMQLILVFWYGVESVYHPQLVDDYYFYFIMLFFFFYVFGFYWIFMDIWKYARTEIIVGDFTYEEARLNKKNLDNVISYLKFKRFKMINIFNLALFLGVLTLAFLFSFFAFISNTFSFSFTLPGTGIEDSEPIQVTYYTYVLIIASPVAAITFFIFSYKTVNEFNLNALEKVLSNLPRVMQLTIIENLNLIQSKVRLERTIE